MRRITGFNLPELKEQTAKSDLDHFAIFPFNPFQHGKAEKLLCVGRREREKSKRFFTQRALVDILVTGSSHVPRRTRAQVSPRDGVGVTVGSLSARVADASIVQLAQESCSAAQTQNLIEVTEKQKR